MYLVYTSGKQITNRHSEFHSKKGTRVVCDRRVALGRSQHTSSVSACASCPACARRARLCNWVCRGVLGHAGGGSCIPSTVCSDTRDMRARTPSLARASSVTTAHHSVLGTRTAMVARPRLHTCGGVWRCRDMPAALAHPRHTRIRCDGCARVSVKQGHDCTMAVIPLHMQAVGRASLPLQICCQGPRCAGT